jgi:alpha,alpha-trehalose-phosphate synthase [UDP-forming]/trehalose-phosphatase
MPRNADHWLRLVRHSPLGVLCDLDGTLLPFTIGPDEAHPGPAEHELLAELGALPGITVAVVSGRHRAQMERFFPDASVNIAAEHGAWLRDSGAWKPAHGLDALPLEALADELRSVLSPVPGALLEIKSTGLAVHYRRVDESRRGQLLVELGVHLAPFLSAHPSYERLDSEHSLELRPAIAKKSVAVGWLREHAGPDARILALGDDYSDEDMFAALGAADESVVVRPRVGRTGARWRLDSVPDVHRFLRAVVAVRRDRATFADAGIVPRPIQRRPPRAPEDSSGLLVISNRLPELRTESSEIDARKKNVGGLVSALAPALARREGQWLGWSGRVTSDETLARGVDAEESPALAWMDLRPDWHRDFYNGFCNATLWPLLHSFPSKVTFADAHWEAYVRVNEEFAKVATELVGRGTPIWAHDYHLLLCARALRQRGHAGPLGMFLHVPFPGPDVFGMLPWVEELLEAMLQFDLIGFHTASYAQNFAYCAGALLDAETGREAVVFRGRRTRLGVFPIGIIPASFNEPSDPAVQQEIEALMRSFQGCALVLGVDRLDYTKGIPERLEAFGRMLEMFPDWRRKVTLLQVSVPSRADVPQYAAQRALIESAVGRINGRFGEAGWVPIHYLYRSYDVAQLTSLYRAARVGYVTPLRDGMNLVAKEFVAAQDVADPGVLVLSKFAGAAVELRDALLVNPYHPDGMARGLDQALRMDERERKTRHAKLLAAVQQRTAETWAEDFLTVLAQSR